MIKCRRRTELDSELLCNRRRRCEVVCRLYTSPELGETEWTEEQGSQNDLFGGIYENRQVCESGHFAVPYVRPEPCGLQVHAAKQGDWRRPGGHDQDARIIQQEHAPGHRAANQHHYVE